MPRVTTTAGNRSVQVESSSVGESLQPLMDHSIYHSAAARSNDAASMYNRAIGNEMYANHTPRLESANATNRHQTSSANEDSLENTRVSPTASGSASLPLVSDYSNEFGQGRFTFPIADPSTDLPTYKDQAGMDRNEETTRRGHRSGAFENNSEPIIFATPMPLDADADSERPVALASVQTIPEPCSLTETTPNTPSQNRDELEEGIPRARRDNDDPLPYPPLIPALNRKSPQEARRRTDRMPCPNWCRQWGVALGAAFVVVLAVVVTAAVTMSDKDALAPLISTPAVPPLAVPPPPSRAPTVTTSSPSLATLDTVPQATFSYDSTASRAINLVNYVNSVTLSGRRLDPDNAPTTALEERALYWMVTADALLTLVPDTNENQGRIAQRYALATLWAAAGGQWSNQQSALNECEWDGITCASSTLVTEIDLSVTDDWNGNGGMSPDLALATSLVHIALSSKSLTGPLPKSIGRLTNLVSFEMQQNDLTGTLPESIGEWTKLERFSVYDNALTGTIPSSISQWTKIQSALFDSNKFSGSVPEGICQFRSLDLTLLNADCVAKVTCNCCTYCA
jgi:hypothetical protein